MSAHSARRMLSLPTRGYSRKRRVGFLILAWASRVVPDGAGSEFFRGIVVMAGFAVGVLALGLGLRSGSRWGPSGAPADA